MPRAQFAPGDLAIAIGVQTEGKIAAIDINTRSKLDPSSFYIPRNIGVVKAYLSRVGTSPLPTELTDATGDLIREKGFEYGTTTGRPRRIGWLDLVQIRQAVRASALTDIVITKIDILSGLKELKICTDYSVNGWHTKEMPVDLPSYRLAQPRYATLPGWENLSEAQIEELIPRGYHALPQNMRNYLEFIEDQIPCKISLVSLGPKRHQTITR